MAKFNKGEVWFVEFPIEEKPSEILNRPVVVLDENKLGVLSVKVTKHKVRAEDPYDTPILYWKQAHLRFASTARVSKVINLKPEAFLMKLGDLHPDDLQNIEQLYMDFVDNNM
jgi:hypothetical protein